MFLNVAGYDVFIGRVVSTHKALIIEVDSEVEGFCCIMLGRWMLHITPAYSHKPMEQNEGINGGEKFKYDRAPYCLYRYDKCPTRGDGQREADGSNDCDVLGCSGTEGGCTKRAA